MFLLSLFFACPVDRTGQSISSLMRSDIQQNKQQLEKIEQQLLNYEKRLSQVENITKARGEADLMKLESIEQVRLELANFRNDLDLTKHASSENSEKLNTLTSDATFRLGWLEERTDQLESQLGFSTPAPPDYPTSYVEQKKTVDESQSGNDIQNENASNDEKGTNTKEDSVPMTPDEIIKKIEEHLANNRLIAAEALLNSFFEKHSDDQNMPRALYRHAEVSYNSGDFKSATQRFQKVLDYEGQSPFKPWAMYRQGECFEGMEQPENAKIFFEDVIQKYPKSKAATEAKMKISKGTDTKNKDEKNNKDDKKKESNNKR